MPTLSSSLRASAHRGAIRIAAPRRITSPLSIWFATLCTARAPNSSGLPSRDGCGTCLQNDYRALRFGPAGVMGRPISARVAHGHRSIERMQPAWPTATLVRLAPHACWLNQVEIYFSGVGPVERCRGPVVAVLKADYAFGDLVEVG